jgi:ribosome-associated heat shock protein Hsp15
MSGVRLDKWLWAARFFKTRTLAAKACELGRIEAVRVGDRLSIKN